MNYLIKNYIENKSFFIDLRKTLSKKDNCLKNYQV